MCQYLLAEGASLHIYDPKVTSDRIYFDLSEQTGTSERECKMNFGNELGLINSILESLVYRRILRRKDGVSSF